MSLLRLRVCLPHVQPNNMPHSLPPFAAHAPDIPRLAVSDETNTVWGFCEVSDENRMHTYRPAGGGPTPPSYVTPVGSSSGS